MQFCIGTIKDDFLGLIGDPGGATWGVSEIVFHVNYLIELPE